MEKIKEKPGWVLITRETDEWYGVVQWRDGDGNMTDKKEAVGIDWNDPKYPYRFLKSGLGQLIIVKSWPS